MRYVFDHDYHIHSQLSLCSNDPDQNTARILSYAQANGLERLCLTDHHWDGSVPGASDWYAKQDWPWIKAAQPLPQSDDVKFMFGCETDMDRHFTVGVAPEHYDRFDFIIVPTTHLHMKGFTISPEDAELPESRAKIWVARLEALLNMKLPFRKVGIAHPVCPLIAPGSREEYLKVLELLPENAMQALFTKAAKLGAGIEINGGDMEFADDEANIVLRPLHIAKACGCKFYIGSDAHHPATLDGAKQVFERAIDLLELTEDDKFHIG